MKKNAYRVQATVTFLITLDAYDEEEALDRADQTPFRNWDERVNIEYEILSVNPDDDYEDASRDD